MFRILREGNKSNGITALAFRKADSFMHRDLTGKVTWEMVLKIRGIQVGRLIFQDHLLQAQERSTPKSRKSS